MAVGSGIIVSEAALSFTVLEPLRDEGRPHCEPTWSVVNGIS
jgi:hypothetical protein